jgi:hypothetical protein
MTDEPPAADPETSSAESATIEAWIDSTIDRRFARQEAVRNTTLPLVTFAEGIAAALVVSALQVGKHQYLLAAASILLGLGVIAIFVVLSRDRFVVVDERRLRTLGLDDSQLLKELRTLQLAVILVNDDVVASMRKAAFIQAIIAATATVLAVLSMLLPA